ncbi:hypothetical protein QUB56_05100 [Microcoleus sp. AR_TQ3_B6]|uniref:hypothetical protein n=1 Tax=Microcoleus sp. AR_TQ3_B6 TaxID=3055284 RepID=UPI002FD1A237
MHSAYINRIGKFLPGEPINNDEREEYLGKKASRPSRVSQRILNSNGIQKGYYAIDKQQQRLYYNSQMAEFAVRAAIFRGEWRIWNQGRSTYWPAPLLYQTY